MSISASLSIRSFSPTSKDTVWDNSLRGTHFLHITGEKTNPAHLEKFIVEHPMVRSAIMFGHGRYNAGILIELEDGYKIDTGNEKRVEDTRNKLQVVIDRMNVFAPQHARVQKEMILFASPAKPFIHTPLSASQINRRDTLAEYNNEINGLYKTIAEATLIPLKPPKIWSPSNCLVYVREVVVNVLGQRIDDNDDIFDCGADSLQATRIRIILFHALQTTAKADTRKLTGNIVYQYRTIAGLATFATRTAMACFRHRTESGLERCLEMTKTVEAYSLAFPIHHPMESPPLNDVILITGTTGLFGSNLLAQFLQSPKVSRVYALNRRKSRPGSVAERQATLLQASGLDPALARHPKLILLEADARQRNLGLQEERYDKLLSSVTHVVHNAWLSTYDDNSSLGIFDGSFCMLRNLVDFALSSPLSNPPRLLFISSTATLRGTSLRSPQSTFETEGTENLPPSVGPASACDAAGNVYSESKWVGEQILAAAASETSLRPIIFRVGPLCGAANGRWREQDLFPPIVHLGATLGALPQIDEVVNWIPVHTAAKAVAEMRDSTSTYLHLTHPRPVSSLSLLSCIGEELSLPLIPVSQWTAKLEAEVHSAPHPSRASRPSSSSSATITTSSSSKLYDPALILLRHVQHARESVATTTEDDMPLPILQHVQIPSDDAWSASPTLRDGVSALGIDEVRLWLRHWREMGLIPGAK